MWMNKWLLCGAEILLSCFAVFLLIYYFDIFFLHRYDGRVSISGCTVFMIWQMVISNFDGFPAYINICIAIVVTMIAVMMIYKGGFGNKCIFSLTFNAIWMLVETLSGYILSIWCDETAYPQIYKLIGSFISKIVFLFIIFALKKVFTNEEIRELPVKYNILFILIPMGSIYIMNDIFLLGRGSDDSIVNLHSIVSAMILLIINALVFYVYMKLADDLRLRRINSVYEQQLELCERHQQEREISTLQLRDMKHNMKNNLISILAYAESGDCKKVADFVNDIMNSGGIMVPTVSNTGNTVVDSLLGYWCVVAEKKGIDFKTDICIPMDIPFKGADICLILGNLLENAVEAAQNADAGKYIKTKMKYDKGNLLLFMENSYNGKLNRAKDGSLKTTKSDSKNHGVGLPSVSRAAAKYNGTVVIDDSVSGKFIIRVVLYGDLQ